MKNLPSWIPYSGSYINAIFLNLLMGVLAFSVKFTQQIGHFLAQNGSLRLGWSFGVLAILSPILVIAVAHHLLHIFLDRFFPNTQSSAIGKTG